MKLLLASMYSLVYATIVAWYSIFFIEHGIPCTILRGRFKGAGSRGKWKTLKTEKLKR